MRASNGTCIRSAHVRASHGTCIRSPACAGRGLDVGRFSKPFAQTDDEDEEEASQEEQMVLINRLHQVCLSVCLSLPLPVSVSVPVSAWA